MPTIYFVHAFLTLLYVAAFLRLWQVWKKNKTERQLNLVMRENLGHLVTDVQAQITENEKIVAKAKRQVTDAMEKIDKNSRVKIPAEAVEFHEDAGMLASILTALVVKHGGELRLSLRDMMLVEGDDYVSVYVDPDEQEMIFSTDHSKHLGMSLVNFSPSDDETYH
jgi:Flp pilus assembly protein TadB